jgi:hypothetical protein
MTERNNNLTEPLDEHSAPSESDGGKRAPSGSKFEHFEDHGRYWIRRNVETKIFYVEWYDSDNRAAGGHASLDVNASEPFARAQVRIDGRPAR